MTGPIADSTTRALAVALDALALRQRTIADNVANLQTPGFQAGRVDFEGSLADAYDSGAAPEGITVRTTRSTAPGGLNGNNVNLDEETIAGSEAGMAYQLGVQAVTDHFTRLRIAMGGSV